MKRERVVNLTSPLSPCAVTSWPPGEGFFLGGDSVEAVPGDNSS